jgi:organic hydroperoxide reductase OsmC/OhrA
MFKLPLEFESSASASGEMSKPWHIQSGDQSANCSVPPEFGGPGGGFSPEDLYLQALINCFVGTFKVYAKGSRINFSRLDVTANLTVDKDAAGAVRMQRCHLYINVLGAEKPDRIKVLVEKVFRDGFILNSVKTEIHYNLLINEASRSNSLPEDHA